VLATEVNHGRNEPLLTQRVPIFAAIFNCSCDFQLFLRFSTVPAIFNCSCDFQLFLRFSTVPGIFDRSLRTQDFPGIFKDLRRFEEFAGQMRILLIRASSNPAATKMNRLRPSYEESRSSSRRIPQLHANICSYKQLLTRLRMKKNLSNGEFRRHLVRDRR
jgi:hypothetical protein